MDNSILSSLSGENQYISIIYKRLRAYLKKKTRLDKLEKQWENDQTQLNEDQRMLLRNKDQILAPLRELEMLAKQFITISQTTTPFIKENEKLEKISLPLIKDKENDKEIKNVQEFGRIRILVGFLKHASMTRYKPTERIEYNIAIERVLQQIYEADEMAIDVIEKLYIGSNEYIDQSETITYRQIKQQIESQLQLEPTISIPLNASTYILNTSSEQKMYDQASNSIQNVTKMGSNESVNITGTSLKDPLVTNYTQVSMNTLPNVSYNHYPTERCVFSPSVHYGMSNPLPMTWESYDTNHPNSTHWNLEKQGPLTSFETQTEEKTRRIKMPDNFVSESKNQGHGEYYGRGSLYNRNNEYFGRGRRKKGFENKSQMNFKMSKKNTHGMDKNFRMNE
ncbi:hypothetical protein PCANB_001272 [Pneumocystis canis]|nr:hypothetical protein PCANB_001272 [Pneumocystis canis]